MVWDRSIAPLIAFLILAVGRDYTASGTFAISASAAFSNAAATSTSEPPTKGVEPKDYLSLTLSALAFGLSLAATVITLRQKNYETERTLRSQLTDAIGKLNASFEAMEKLREEKMSTWNTPPVLNLKTFYNGQKLFYARQAIYVSDQIAHLVSDSEYNSIARAFADSDDDAEAFRYYEKAISAASNAFHKATSLRGYGRLLIRAGRIDDGRQQFEKALGLVSENSDSAHWFRGETLQRWGQIEALREEHAAAEMQFDRASSEYSAIAFLPRRTEGLANLGLARQAITPSKKSNSVKDAPNSA